MISSTVCDGEPEVSTTELGVGPEQTVVLPAPPPVETEIDAVTEDSDVVRVHE